MMKRILIVDDEPHVVEGLRHLLRAPDRRIETSSSARQALECIRAELPDLLITDIIMPEMSGLELIAELRADPRTRNLRIIIVTAKGQAQDAAMTQEAWGAMVIAKPFEPRRVRETVAACLDAVACPPHGSI